ncbi:hypothetical protein CHELA1G11_20600 [Hyphomicrobiales bacterium]|nr:hypothetical protein CHELA1G11_20600 [Hyphomicrobiales bacterium]CAH1691004.1 hypothetical protein CHELA1G2_20916 [Hyphomicrobiales bacterium]
MSRAKGTMAIAAQKNTKPAGRLPARSRMTAAGAKISNQLSDSIDLSFPERLEVLRIGSVAMILFTRNQAAII